tara:strand:+ start:5503 stop:5670 length:168 start_codon:yes stop_codon:yes gene_type:complete
LYNDRRDIELDCIEWCDKKIKEASDNSDIKSFEAYTELRDVWSRQAEDNKKAAIQ